MYYILLLLNFSWLPLGKSWWVFLTELVLTELVLLLPRKTLLFFFLKLFHFFTQSQTFFHRIIILSLTCCPLFSFFEILLRLTRSHSLPSTCKSQDALDTVFLSVKMTHSIVKKPQAKTFCRPLNFTNFV